MPPNCSTYAALEKLEQLDERQSRIIEMSYFSGMTGDEIAEEIGAHCNTVVREVRMARAWCTRRPRGDDVREDGVPGKARR